MKRVHLEIRYRAAFGKSQVISGWALRGELNSGGFGVACPVAIPYGTELSITVIDAGQPGTASERLFHASSVGFLELSNEFRVIPTTHKPRFKYRVLLKVDSESTARAEAAIAACEPIPA
jgi:hypothetical protein